MKEKKEQFNVGTLVKKIYFNRLMLRDLVKNDFKMRYSGSILGTIWAYIHPIVTILVYWFVFQVGLRNGSVEGVPFVLWFIAGIIPWFYNAEAWSGASGSLIDYSYLVKKVMFDIEVIPAIRIIGSLVVHAFFVLIMLAVYVFSGFFPSIYWLQLIYYAICLMFIATGMAYFTSTLVVFFRDLTQIVSIVLEVGMWLTPIMWQDTVLPEWLRPVFKLNPMYYIVKGYRDAVIYHVWFWEDVAYTVYFWVIAILIMSIGLNVFGRMRGLLADSL